jgi:HlyD family secretion protein
MAIRIPRIPRKWALVGLALLLLAGFVFVALRSGPLAPVRVTVAKVERATIAPTLFGIGTVEARRSYVIGATSAGRVKRVLVDAGDTVRAGQLLAEMDPVDLDQRIAATAAALARAGSAATAAEAQLRDAAARRELAVSSARRYEELGAKGFVSATLVEAKAQERASAEAGMAAAEANLAAARQDRVRLAAERDGLRQQRDNVRLFAPSAGVVTARDAEPGSTVVAGQAVLRLVDPASLWVKLRLDQSRSSGLSVSVPAEILLRSRPGEGFAGKVARVEWLSDAVTEERIAQVAFDSPPAGLSVGELAEVTLRLPATSGALAVPNAAIKYQNGQAGVWRIVDGRTRFHPVRVGAQGEDGKTQISDGLAEGAQVIVYSERSLTAGQRVKVVQALAGKRP